MDPDERSVTRHSIFLISLGCPRNLVDSEILFGKLKGEGFHVSGEFKKQKIAIVNTCGFIADAKNESIDVIMELASLKKERRLSHLIVTGCLSQRYKESLLEEIEEIDAIFGCSTFTEIPEYIKKISKAGRLVRIEEAPSFLYNHNTPRSIISPKHSVYVKIQEGCMNSCSYCVIPKIRGPFRSRSMKSLLAEISLFRKAGAKEINLIGQDTTHYGIDRYKSLMLADLLKSASEIMESRWVRVLYTHPAHYTERLIDAIKNEPSICKYLDLPIQHINDRILKRMNRHTKKADIEKLIEKLRKKVPGVAIRTSVIIGFPGESDKDFEELAEFIKKTGFDRLGAFIYSQEEGTAAYSFPNQLPHKEKSRRFDHVMQVQQDVSKKKNESYLGKSFKVLIDEKDSSLSGQYIGRTEHDAPDVDGLVYVKSRLRLKQGDFVNVKIEDTLEYDLVGSHEPSE